MFEFLIHKGVAMENTLRLGGQVKNIPVRMFGAPNRTVILQKYNLTVNYYLILYLQDLTVVSMVTSGC